MQTTVAFIILAAVIFFIFFINKQRFGLLGLSLAAGSILSNIWSDEISLIASGLGLPDSFSADLVVKIAIILLPPFVLLFSGSKCKPIIPRLIGASLFTILSFGFMIDPISRSVVLGGPGLEILKCINENSMYIIGFGVIIAILDLFFTKKPSEPTPNKKHEG